MRLEISKDYKMRWIGWVIAQLKLSEIEVARQFHTILSSPFLAMDHLELPPGAKPILIPYVCKEDFILDNPENPNDEFKTYPKRNNAWKMNEKLELIIEDSRSPEEVVELLQRWLFFGVAKCCLYGMETSDFVRDDPAGGGKKVVQTRLLEYFMQDWIVNNRKLDKEKIARDDPHFELVMSSTFREYLITAYGHLRTFRRWYASCKTNPAIDNYPLVELSVMALGESLASVLVANYSSCIGWQDMPKWYPSSILKKRLLDQGWCVSDSPFFPDSPATAPISADYYFGGLPCPIDRGSHENCSEAICNAYKTVINTGSYRPKHIPDCPGCCHIVAPAEVPDIVDQRGIPVIRWDGEKITASVHDKSSPYVAISHVWADGLGTWDIENSLPRCQLTRIQGLVDGLYSDKHFSNSYDYIPDPMHEARHAGFWMDTLCVPVGESYHDIRKSAIQQMGDIYRGADRVLVLDSSILELSRSADVIDKYTRIHLSGWHHRLWTLQEGQLAAQLFFQFKDGAETFYDMTQSERQFVDRNNLPADFVYKPIKPLCSTELEYFYRFFEDSAVSATQDITTRLRSCAKYLRSRQTSKIIDEPVCLSTVLGFDNKTILQQKTTEERMKAFYNLIRMFDARIIFNNHPRLISDGYRWAPSTFLHNHEDLISTLESTKADRRAFLLENEKGLHIDLPGFEFSISDVSHALQGNDAVVVLPLPDTVPPQHKHFPLFTKVPWWLYRYKVQPLVQSQTSEPFTWDPKKRYAVIVYNEMHHELVRSGSPAIIGTIEGHNARVEVPGTLGPKDAQYQQRLTYSLTSPVPNMWMPIHTTQRRLTIRFVCRAEVITVYDDHEISPEIPCTDATVYSRTQKWCIL